MTYTLPIDDCCNFYSHDDRCPYAPYTTEPTCLECDSPTDYMYVTKYGCDIAGCEECIIDVDVDGEICPKCEKEADVHYKDGSDFEILGCNNCLRKRPAHEVVTGMYV